ncbi:uncharacterized protein STEHIDRAFT_109591 [Stereum hirsutum FP-91666 SS1]|uniref:uncharacterized protein n=1 Tax=Stereum hirsutum (strain FP-91666) TaxID=721885 RepID=UPI000440C74B|nr:uncharacterized protein STEHIDRAFT_109591 [Stereum hirsutum FP-91666 SS1]EIM89403.1 hypothetical protein STEHIDRAFT_109591 [Stereum hirsutum FP-91666 SS1]
MPLEKTREKRRRRCRSAESDRRHHQKSKYLTANGKENNMARDRICPRLAVDYGPIRPDQVDIEKEIGHEAIKKGKLIRELNPEWGETQKSQGERRNNWCAKVTVKIEHIAKKKDWLSLYSRVAKFVEAARVTDNAPRSYATGCKASTQFFQSNSETVGYSERSQWKRATMNEHRENQKSIRGFKREKKCIQRHLRAREQGTTWAQPLADVRVDKRTDALSMTKRKT